MPQLTQINDIARILSHPTWDIMVVFALLAAGFFYGITAGKTRIAATIIYTYAAFALTSVLPLDKFAVKFSETEALFFTVGIFLAVFLLTAFLLGSRRSAGRAPASSWWQIFLMAFLQVGLLIHILLNFLPTKYMEMLAPLTRTVFANPDLRVWWFVVPLAALIIMRRFEARGDT